MTVFGGQVGFYGLWRRRKESDDESRLDKATEITVTCLEKDAGSLCVIATTLRTRFHSGHNVVLDTKGNIVHFEIYIYI